MYLLDTTHCLRLFWGILDEKLLKLGKVIVSTSVIARGELLYGVYKSELVDENLVEIERFLDILDVYHISDETADIYGNLKGTIIKQFGPKDKSKRRNFKIESLGFKDNDLWISATAIQYELILVSADKHVQRLNGINGLRVESW
jgi:tRNA(fMet)-specific endonuclease VapC